MRVEFHLPSSCWDWEVDATVPTTWWSTTLCCLLGANGWRHTNRNSDSVYLAAYLPSYLLAVLKSYFQLARFSFVIKHFQEQSRSQLFIKSTIEYSIPCNAQFLSFSEVCYSFLCNLQYVYVQAMEILLLHNKMKQTQEKLIF